MNNETQIFFDVAVAVIGAMGGWILNTVWVAVKELQKADKELAEKIGEIEVLVAGRYMMREDFDRAVTAIFARLDKIQDMLAMKADR